MSAKSTMTFVALVLALDALFVFAKMSGAGIYVDGSRVDFGGQGWNCAHVISHPVEVRRELVSRNLEGDHKIIKFIENCIKSVDGWRFKKSGNPSLRTAYALGNNLMAMPVIKSEVAPLNEDLLPYPMRYASLKGTLEKKSDSSSSSPSAPAAAAAATSSSSSAAQQKEAVGLQRPEMFEEAQFIGYADSD